MLLFTVHKMIVSAFAVQWTPGPLGTRMYNVHHAPCKYPKMLFLMYHTGAVILSSLLVRNHLSTRSSSPSTFVTPLFRAGSSASFSLSFGGCFIGIAQFLTRSYTCESESVLCPFSMRTSTSSAKSMSWYVHHLFYTSPSLLNEYPHFVGFNLSLPLVIVLCST